MLLDQRGRVVAGSPSDPSLRGVRLASKYPHLAAALTGTPTVSDVVVSAVDREPIVAFALPLDNGRRGVLSGGFSFKDSPLQNYLSTSPIPGTRGYIVDSADVPVVFAGEGAGRDLGDIDVEQALSGPRVVGDRVTVAAPIAGTPWRLILNAPVESVTAPATSNDNISWGVLVGAALLTLLGLVLLGRSAAARTRSREAQAEADQRFRLTVENAPIGMTMVRLDGTFLEPNQQLCRILGYAPEQLCAMTFQEITHPDDLESDLALLDRLRAGEISHYEMEKRYIRQDHSFVWARLTVSLVRDSHDRPLHYVSQVEDVTEMRAAQEKLEQRALYDPLTGLANRGLLIDRMTHALARRDDDDLVAVGFCDLDHFKRINDSLGHHAGDTLLREVARPIQGAVRGNDTVARMGGDEFVLLLPDVESLATAQAIMERARQAVQEPIQVGSNSLGIGISAGLAISSAGRSAEMLLRDADTAMYAAKANGRSRCAVYTSAMRSRALMHLSVESELRRAIECDEFELHYQPIVKLVDPQTVAYEALVRWRHPNRGLLLPGAFLEVAEESQLIGELGALVLRHACQFLAQHPQASWRVFVNVSPVELGRGLDGVVITELEAADVPASRLGLEITENGALNATGSSLAEMKRLRAIGIEMLMDDFGTGYSALSSVLTTPITGIKLDRSFTAQLGDGGTADRITSTVANLVQSLGLHGVAEGIETEEQRSQALKHGWTHGQGYLFARPSRPGPSSSLDRQPR
ncbi:MAG TPA: EAL domain-containing protein [Nocardioidaceae bacterium]|nr:EAL domain-containing protein [Nocardioidaceae bacterium]